MLQMNLFNTHFQYLFLILSYTLGKIYILSNYHEARNFLHYLESAKLIQLWETWRVVWDQTSLQEYGISMVQLWWKFYFLVPFGMTAEQQVTTATGYLLQRVSGVVERFSWQCSSRLGSTQSSNKFCELFAAAAAKLLQSCPTLCDPIDGSPPGSPIPGILQARTLEWVAISFSNAWKWKVKVRSLSPVPLPATPWTVAHQALPSMGFSRQ